MRFQLSAFASLALLIASASASAGHCNDGETQMCCQNLDERNVGYYCATPDQEFPCYIGSPQLQAMCCTGYDRTARGYTASNCRIVEVASENPSPEVPPATEAPKAPKQCKRAARR